jgi:peptide deformylase
MLVHMWRWHGIGLAAPQAGVDLRLIVAEVGGQRLGLANPVLLEARGAEEMLEACLSLPGKGVNVVRQSSAWVRALDIENRPLELRLDGLLARVVQHEIDHLDGVLIIDRGPIVQGQASEQRDA